MSRIGWISIVGALLAGCSSGDSGQGLNEAAQAPATDEQAPAETVFDPMVGTIDRAKSVDAVSADRMKELNKQLGEAE